MKKMSKNMLLIVVGILVAFTIDVAAEAVISSGAVSYSNTTVSAALDELFSAVDINNKIGNISEISSIGNGTIANAIYTINSNNVSLANYRKALSHNGDIVGSELGTASSPKLIFAFDINNPYLYWFGIYGFTAYETYVCQTIISNGLTVEANAFGTINFKGGSGKYNYYNIVPTNFIS